MSRRRWVARVRPRLSGHELIESCPQSLEEALRSQRDRLPRHRHRDDDGISTSAVSAAHATALKHKQHQQGEEYQDSRPTQTAHWRRGPRSHGNGGFCTPVPVPSSAILLLGLPRVPPYPPVRARGHTLWPAPGHCGITLHRGHARRRKSTNHVQTLVPVSLPVHSLSCRSSRISTRPHPKPLGFKLLGLGQLFRNHHAL